ncbi:MAG: MBL fold metallo-hydrolase [bacterium]|nr:MBL fold metallo-hydrolase [bacterium]
MRVDEQRGDGHGHLDQAGRANGLTKRPVRTRGGDHGLPTENYIRFLGTAGSRWVVSRQLRASGGIYLNLCGQQIVVDPGPGALVRCAQTQPPIEVADLDALIVTHRHIDHCSDVTILLDGITGGGLHRRGKLFAPASCLTDSDAIMMGYVRRFVDEVATQPESSYEVGDLRFRTSIPHNHGSDTYGLIFDVAGRELAFLVDTRFFPELIDAYAGVDTLVINATLEKQPESTRIFHLGMDDVREIARGVRPRRLVLTHFGMGVLDLGPERLASAMADELGLDIVAAEDSMRLDV